MKISINSLNTYLQHKLPTEEVVRLLGLTEVEVEEVLYSNTWDKNIITAQVVRVEAHPDADKLRIAHVATSADGATGSNSQIVCGAANLAKDQIVVLAQPGSVLPDGLEIRASKLRGVMSHGMLCSSYELGISDDHAGILVLDPATPVGKPLCDIWENADILDIKTPANRWDYLSLIGLAREVAARDDIRENSLKMPNTLAEADLSYERIERAYVKETGECKRFLTVKCRVDNAVKTPQWIVDNLEGNGMRSISPVVDLTNFVMLETGQPLHAYDAQKLRGNIGVQLASPAAQLTTLDGVSRTLSSEDLVIVDDRGPIGLAGVMGGAETEVDENTTEILLEAAHFDKSRIRRAALRHGLRTEASARYERSLPLSLPRFAFERMVYLLTTELGAEMTDSPVDQLYGWPWVQQIGLRIRRAEKLLGTELDEKQVVRGLQKLGFEVEHFSITKESKKHLGKPYVWGANFRKHGESGFDCSYLIDRIYSRIGVDVGHTALGQFHHGRPVEIGELKPGDVVYYAGKVDKSATDHYYIPDGNGGNTRVELKEPLHVGHNGVYIGDNKVITAIQYERRGNEWVQRSKQGVIEVPLSDFTNEPTYLGARRYVESFNHILAITAPWWRADVKAEEDIIEEITKIIGYDTIPATLPQLPATNTRPHQFLPRLIELKKALVATGLFDITTYSFISEEDTALAGDSSGTYLEIVRPLSREQQYLRRSMLPSHLRVVKNNSTYRKEYAFFEISRIHEATELGLSPRQPNEVWRLAITTVGTHSALRLKHTIDILMAYTHNTATYKTIDAPVNFVAGRYAGVKLRKQVVGNYGQLGKQALDNLGVVPEVSFGEVTLTPLLESAREVVATDLPQYQYVARDVSLVCPNTTSWQAIESVATGIKQIVRVEFLSDYTNDQLEQKSQKNLAFRVQLDLGATPTSQAIQASVDILEQRLMRAPELGNITII